MATILPISKEQHADKRCRTNVGYGFAAQDAVMVLGLQELPRAALAMPIALIKDGDEYMTAAVQGLKPKQNLLVSPEGKWRTNYIPAQYRAYPFVLAQQEDRSILCMRDPDTYLSDTEGRPLFGDDGEPTEAVRQLIQFLNQVRHDRQVMLRQCALLDELGLIQAWPLTIKADAGEQSVGGLYRVSEEAMSNLSGEDMLRLRPVLPLVYCQLLSMQHIHALARLAQRVQGQPQNKGDGLALTQDGELDLDFLSDDGTIKFH